MFMVLLPGAWDRYEVHALGYGMAFNPGDCPATGRSASDLRKDVARSALTLQWPCRPAGRVFVSTSRLVQLSCRIVLQLLQFHARSKVRRISYQSA